MRAEILSIGTEILVGSILNTNARFLSQRLAENGVDVFRQVTVGDNISRISEAIGAALSRADLVVTSGGLGPTEDDATLRGLAAYLGVPLVRHKPTERAIRTRLKKRGYRFTDLIAKECDIPQGARRVFQNRNGTAPGILYEIRRIGHRSGWVLLLPGPPRELEPMFLSQALPILRRLSGAGKESFLIRSLRLACVAESRVAEKIPDILKWRPPLTVGIYAKPGEVELKIMSKSPSLRKAKLGIRRAEKILRRRLGNTIYGADDDTLAGVVGSCFRKCRLTLAVAESCTGGALGAALTDAPGSSDFFLGGVTSYANTAKSDLLMVAPKILSRHGAVSSAAARQMALGARDRFKSDHAISITGIAGPSGGTAKKPVGTVFIGMAGPEGCVVHRHLFFGDRAAIRRQAVQAALNALRLGSR